MRKIKRKRKKKMKKERKKERKRERVYRSVKLSILHFQSAWDVCASKMNEPGNPAHFPAPPTCNNNVGAGPPLGWEQIPFGSLKVTMHGSKPLLFC